MAMSINSLVHSDINSVFYDPGFRRTLELHMAWLRSHPTTERMAVSSFLGYKYQGDIFSMLSEMQIERKYHWVIMRLNDKFRTGDVDEHIAFLLVPSFDLLERLRQSYQPA